MSLQPHVKFKLINWKSIYNTNLLLLLMNGFLIPQNIQPKEEKVTASFYTWMHIFNDATLWPVAISTH